MAVVSCKASSPVASAALAGFAGLAAFGALAGFAAGAGRAVAVPSTIARMRSWKLASLAVSRFYKTNLIIVEAA